MKHKNPVRFLNSHRKSRLLARFLIQRVIFSGVFIIKQ